MFDVQDLVDQQLPKTGVKRLFKRPLTWFFKKLFHEKEFAAFAKKHPDLNGLNLVRESLNYFNFSYQVEPKQLINIPAQGRVVIVSNHPIGSLDGLALVDMVAKHRPDVRIVANQVLNKINAFYPIFLTVDNIGGKTAKAQFREIKEHLSKESAVIIFPAGRVSRHGPEGIKDKEWQRGFVKIATDTHSPVLPIFTSGRNSNFFYLLSKIHRALSAIWLIPEMFKQRDKKINFSIGQIIPYKEYSSKGINEKALADLFRIHVYNLQPSAKLPVALFKTQKGLIPPQDPNLVQTGVEKSLLLGETSDGKTIYLFNEHSNSFDFNSPVALELGRLRELSFRAAGGGTGKEVDLDKYDGHNMHLLLWDNQERDIVGAYRICDTAKIVPKLGVKGLYNASLYQYNDTIKAHFGQSIELGRSFIQPKYWGKRSLDHLWYGIGALIRNNPNYRYLFGSATISSGYTDKAKMMIVYFYGIHYPPKENFINSLNPFVINKDDKEWLRQLFPGNNYQTEFSLLKKKLKTMGYSVPPLYKQYCALDNEGSVSISVPTVDSKINSVVSFVMVDVWNLKPSKHDRYIQIKLGD